jgi:hypothetical protein
MKVIIYVSFDATQAPTPIPIPDHLDQAKWAGPKLAKLVRHEHDPARTVVGLVGLRPALSRAQALP